MSSSVVSVNVHNEWDPLTAVIVGINDNGCIAPESDPGIRVSQIYGSKKFVNGELIKPGRRPPETYVNSTRELENLKSVLKSFQVTILEPEIEDWSLPVTTPWWHISNQHGTSCPRDVVTVIGNEIIESGMSMRSRFFEYAAYRKIIQKLVDDNPDVRWTAAPKPTLKDSSYNMDFAFGDTDPLRLQQIAAKHFVTSEEDIIFEAADILRMGKDIFVNHGFSTNKRGIDWLRRNLGRSYRVHDVSFPRDSEPVHIDANFVCIRPPTSERKGLIYNNPEHGLEEDKYAPFLPSFDVVNAPDAAHEDSGPRSLCSQWLNMNLLHINPGTVVVEETEKATIRAIESLGLKVIPIPFRACYEFGGSLHCHTTCINRTGDRQNYFPHLD